MTKRWIYSDPHYFHTNIIRYTSRPFETIEHMNEELIKRHNSKVGKKDTVIIAGDFSLGGKAETEKVVSRLKGRKILIMGNHDKARSRNWWLNVGFDEVIKFPIIVNQFFIISHEPVFLNDSMPYVNFHGHIHSQLITGGNYFNVCGEHNDFYPHDLDKLIGGKVSYEQSPKDINSM